MRNWRSASVAGLVLATFIAHDFHPALTLWAAWVTILVTASLYCSYRYEMLYEKAQAAFEEPPNGTMPFLWFCIIGGSLGVVFGLLNSLGWGCLVTGLVSGLAAFVPGFISSILPNASELT